MPGSGLIIVLAAALPAAAGASILLVLWLVCHMQKGAKDRQERRSGTHISMIWPSMTDKLEGSITKRIKASNNGINGLKDLFDSSVKQSSKIASVWRSTYPIKAFKWADHPHLVAEAVEHGWSTFAFTFANMDAPIPPTLWESCTRFSYFPDKLGQPELTWEVNGASSEYMQKIRLNPSLKNSTKRELYLDGLISTVQSLQTTLPLPGPPLGPLSFPQEGYYEITVFCSDGNHEGFAELSPSSFNENEHAHLIAPRSSSTHHGYASFDASPSGVAEINTHKRPSSFGINDFSKEGRSVENPTKVSTNIADTLTLQSATNEQHICAIGLAAGSAPPFRLPGSDTASIGFFSNGRIFINGKEQKKPEGWQRRIWTPCTTAASMPMIVGCGFDPSARRFFFTLNGEMVEEIMLLHVQGNSQGDSPAQGAAAGTDKLMEFTANPLFPTVGANYSVTVTANFGQAAFAYAAANAQRVSDPCFRRPQGGGIKAAGEDSADLFSMGRIDSEWLADADAEGGKALASPGRVNAPLLTPPAQSSSSTSTATATPTSTSTSTAVNPTSQEYTGQGDSDLFEITIDSRTF